MALAQSSSKTYLFGFSTTSFIRKQPLILKINIFSIQYVSHKVTSLTLNLVPLTISAFRPHTPFFVAAPMLWNSIPLAVLSQLTAGSFTYRLKHLVCNYVVFCVIDNLIQLVSISNLFLFCIYLCLIILI